MTENENPNLSLFFFSFFFFFFIGFTSIAQLNISGKVVDQNGILKNLLSVEYSGYWIYEKAANLLPYNYQPD